MQGNQDNIPVVATSDVVVVGGGADRDGDVEIQVTHALKGERQRPGVVRRFARYVHLGRAVRVSATILAGVAEVLQSEGRMVRFRREEFNSAQRFGPQRDKPAGVGVEGQTVDRGFQDQSAHRLFPS